MSDRLDPGQRLLADESLYSKDGQFRLILQQDGNLVLYKEHGGGPIWASNTTGKAPSFAAMQNDGNFVLYGPGGVAHWATGTTGMGTSFLFVQNDANLVVYNPSGPVWDRHSGLLRNSDELRAGQRLVVDDSIYSKSGAFRLILQQDGNLVLYKEHGGGPIWASNTTGKAPSFAAMQNDGNFTLHGPGGLPYWATETLGVGCRLLVQDDSNLVIYGSTGPIWDRYVGVIKSPSKKRWIETIVSKVPMFEETKWVFQGVNSHIERRTVYNALSIKLSVLEDDYEKWRALLVCIAASTLLTLGLHAYAIGTPVTWVLVVQAVLASAVVCFNQISPETFRNADETHEAAARIVRYRGEWHRV